MPARIGFVGLGVMGLPMARNLLEAGYEVVAASRSEGPVDELVRDGAVRAASPAEVAGAVDVTIMMLPDDLAVERVVEGPDGIAKGAGAGHLVVDMSTVSPARAVRTTEVMAGVGGSALDAPVSGGDAGARSGTLAIMVGGSAADFERAQPVFAVLGGTVVHVGGPGTGQVVKACNQVVVAVTIEAVAEALVLGSRCGVSPATIVEVLSGGLAGSKVMEVRGPNMLGHDFTPGFRLDLHHKDLGIALATARSNGVSLPLTAQVDQAMASLRARGRGGDDHSALLTYVEELADHRIEG